VDLSANAALKSGLELLLSSGKVVGSVCHGPMAFVNLKDASGQPFVQGKKVCYNCDRFLLLPTFIYVYLHVWSTEFMVLRISLLTLTRALCVCVCGLCFCWDLTMISSSCPEWLLMM